MSTGRYSAEQESEKLDTITQMLDRDAFYQRARQLLDENPEVEFDFITSDIENFRIVNDRYGYERGDELLCFSAKHIQKAVEKMGGICGRYFADVFMAIIPRTEELYNDIVETTESDLSQCPIQPAPKIRYGIYPIQERDLPISAMYDRSMLALSSIKEHHRVAYGVFEEKHREEMLKEQMILDSIEDAIRNEEITIYLQPKYNLATRKINGAEALVRWISPTEGFISPGEFIPILERKGRIFALDYYVWELACRAVRKWLDSGMPIVPVSVNVSRVDIDDSRFEEIFLDLIRKYEIPPEYMILEITETAYSSLDRDLMCVIESMRGRGFKVEMDDFGSGYSSLNMLKDFTIDDLKIDLNFLSGIGENARGEKILRLVIDLAYDLELGVIAEGVEESHQADFLTDIGCQSAQGYYFARPMPLEDFEKFLAEDQEDLEENEGTC